MGNHRQEVLQGSCTRNETTLAKSELVGSIRRVLFFPFPHPLPLTPSFLLWQCIEQKDMCVSKDHRGSFIHLLNNWFISVP